MFYLHFKDEETVYQRVSILLEGAQLVKCLGLKFISVDMLLKLDLNQLVN